MQRADARGGIVSLLSPDPGGPPLSTGSGGQLGPSVLGRGGRDVCFLGGLYSDSYLGVGSPARSVLGTYWSKIN